MLSLLYCFGTHDILTNMKVENILLMLVTLFQLFINSEPQSTIIYIIYLYMPTTIRSVID